MFVRLWCWLWWRLVRWLVLFICMIFCVWVWCRVLVFIVCYLWVKWSILDFFCGGGVDCFVVLFFVMMDVRVEIVWCFFLVVVVGCLLDMILFDRSCRVVWFWGFVFCCNELWVWWILYYLRLCGGGVYWLLWLVFVLLVISMLLLYCFLWWCGFVFLWVLWVWWRLWCGCFIYICNLLVCRFGWW